MRSHRIRSVSMEIDVRMVRENIVGKNLGGGTRSPYVALAVLKFAM